VDTMAQALLRAGLITEAPKTREERAIEDHRRAREKALASEIDDIAEQLRLGRDEIYVADDLKRLAREYADVCDSVAELKKRL